MLADFFLASLRLIEEVESNRMTVGEAVEEANFAGPSWKKNWSHICHNVILNWRLLELLEWHAWILGLSVSIWCVLSLSLSLSLSLPPSLPPSPPSHYHLFQCF